MAGPTSEVLLEDDDGSTLDAIDQVLASVADQIERTRKGRVWNLFIRGRPVHVKVTGTPPTVELSAGCNAPEDYDVLRELCDVLLQAVGGIASEPEK